ncbi:MAG TPA: cytochrome c peroxidase, partial [Chroococcales cyanobacterium]
MPIKPSYFPIGFSALTVACLIAGTSIVQANTQTQSNFLGSLFPPGFTARVTGASLGKQQTNSMKVPKDNSALRQFARQAKTKQQSSSSPMVQLGLQLFNDRNLSNPVGQSCASCHGQPEGFT